MPESRIDRIEGDLLLSGEDEKLRLALDFARRISRSNPAPSREDVEALRKAGYSDDQIREIAFVTATGASGPISLRLPKAME